MNAFENIGLSTPWVIGLIVTASLLGLSALGFLGWLIHYQIDTVLEEKRKRAYLDRKPKVDDPYGSSYGYYSQNKDYFGWYIPAILLGAIGVFVAICQVIGMIPFNEKYLNWYTIEGTVINVEGVLNTDNKYVNNEFVVTLDSTEVPLYFDDTRILTQQGKEVTLLCGFSWVNFGNSADEANCSIREAEYTD